MISMVNKEDLTGVISYPFFFTKAMNSSLLSSPPPVISLEKKSATKIIFLFMCL